MNGSEFVPQADSILNVTTHELVLPACSGCITVHSLHRRPRIAVPMIARYPAHIPVALFAVWTGLARAGGPPCPSGRPVAVCRIRQSIFVQRGPVGSQLPTHRDDIRRRAGRLQRGNHSQRVGARMVSRSCRFSFICILKADAPAGFLATIPLCAAKALAVITIPTP